jgi:hypothetical protein
VLVKAVAHVTVTMGFPLGAVVVLHRTVPDCEVQAKPSAVSQLQAGVPVVPSAVPGVKVTVCGVVLLAQPAISCPELLALMHVAFARSAT